MLKRLRRVNKKRLGVVVIASFIGMSLAIGGTTGAIAEPTTPDTTTSGGSGVEAANDRIQANIQYASGKRTIKDGVPKITEEELKIIGVFASNFYRPFVTQVGFGADNDEATKKSKEEITKIFSQALKFDKAMSEGMANWVLGRIRADSKVLKWGETDSLSPSDGEITEVKDLPANYYTLQLAISGLTSFPKNDGKTSKKYMVLYYDDGGKKPAFVLDKKANEITPSVSALMFAAYSSYPEYGFGFNLMGYKGADSNDKFKKLYEKYGKDFLKSISTLNPVDGLRVSPFGDIIIMSKEAQYVAIPGALNPFNWSDPDGKRIGGKVNIVNSFALGGIGKVGRESRPDEAKELDKGKPIPHVTMSVQEIQKKVSSNSDYARTNRGTNEYRLSDNRFSGSSELVQQFRDLLDVYKKNEYIKGSYYTSTGGVDNTRGWLEAWTFTEGKASILYPFFWNISIKTRRFDSIINPFQKCGTGRDYCKQQVVNSTPVIQPSGPTIAWVMVKLVDDKGTKGWASGSEVGDYKTFPEKSVFSMAGEFQKNDELTQAFSSFDPSQEVGDFSIPVQSDITSVSLYISYVMSTGENVDKESTVNKLGWKYAGLSSMPKLTNNKLNFDEDGKFKKDLQTEAIRNWTYYFLHPVEGVRYFTEWFSNKVGGVLLDINHRILGTKGMGVLPGSTHYLGFSGYVTTPELSDVPWTDNILKLYNHNIVYIVLIMMVLMVGYVVAGMLTIKRAVAGVIIFGICAIIPANAINMSVSISNSFSNWLYSEKFTFWALVQSQTYIQQIDEAGKQKDYGNYVKGLYKAENGVKGGNGVVVKWQAPKKTTSLFITKDEKAQLGAKHSYILKGIFNSTFSNESFVDDPESVYLYRDYVDIMNFARYSYGSLKGSMGSDSSIRKVVPVGTVESSGFNKSLQDSWKMGADEYAQVRKLGYNNPDKNGGSDFTTQVQIQSPLSSKIVTDAFQTTKDKILKLKKGEYVGIDQRAFNFSIPMFTSYGGNSGTGNVMTFKNQLENTENGGYKSSYPEDDYPGILTYALMSENPYYWFTWQMYNQGMDTGEKAGGYKDLILKGKDNAYFYNVGVNGKDEYHNGEMKDFLDMRSLFTYIIPYLRQGNQVVKAWDEVYGLKIYEGVPTEEGHEAEVKDDPVLSQRYWHNVNVARLFMIYSPWVDLLDQGGYSKPQTVNANGEKFTVNNPTDPRSYPESRPMVFSRTEMNDMGLKENQLTTAENLIIKFNDSMQERMFNMLNYYNFNDSVVASAVGVQGSFEFNRLFSERHFFSENLELYPKGFEIRNFSYDAFLRLILSNSTGDSILQVDNTQNNPSSDGENYKDFYKRLVDNTSIITAIFLNINSILAVYGVPAFKIFFVVGIFILSVMVLIASAVKVEENIFKNIVKGVIKPLAVYLIVSMGMAWVVSWFMGNGNTAVTGYDGVSIALGDPTITIVVIAFINLVVLWLYFKLAKGLVSDIKRYGSQLANSFSGMVSGVASSVSNSVGGSRVAGGAKAILGGVAGYIAGSSMAGRRMAGNVGSRALNTGGSLGKSAGSKGMESLKKGRKMVTKAGRQELRDQKDIAKADKIRKQEIMERKAQRAREVIDRKAKEGEEKLKAKNLEKEQARQERRERREKRNEELRKLFRRDGK